MQFRAEPGRHQDCRPVFASFARLNHSGPITFYAEMGMMFSERSRRICKFFTPKSTQVCAVPERGNQGQTQHKGTAAGTAYATLVARRRSRRGHSILNTQRPGLLKRPRRPSRSSSFLLLLKIDGKPCFTFFFSPFSPFPVKWFIE
jgi:hypothetical protein